jgi:hypothetical protein
MLNWLLFRERCSRGAGSSYSSKTTSAIPNEPYCGMTSSSSNLHLPLAFRTSCDLRYRNLLPLRSARQNTAGADEVLDRGARIVAAAIAGLVTMVPGNGGFQPTAPTSCDETRAGTKEYEGRRTPATTTGRHRLWNRREGALAIKPIRRSPTPSPETFCRGTTTTFSCNRRRTGQNPRSRQIRRSSARNRPRVRRDLDGVPYSRLTLEISGKRDEK